MKKFFLPLLILGFVAACQKPNELDAKKKELEAAKAEMLAIKEKISLLEATIRETDPNFGKTNNVVNITEWIAEKKTFEHLVDFRGTVTSKRNVSLSTTMGGRIESVSVKEGQAVRTGQVLVTTDGSVLRHSIAEIKTQLELATTAFNKQSALWAQKIGTEMQYLQAKNQKESLEKRLATTQAQLDQTLVRAPFDGIVDKVDALEGEMAIPGMPLVRMVNGSGLYVKADVSEEFIGKFTSGQKAEVFFPNSNKTVSASVMSVGQVINPENRTFEIEVAVGEPGLKSNQVAIVKLRDYVNQQSFAVPTKILQRDNTGQFLFTIDKTGKTPTAKKLYVKTGISYNNLTEITEGLSGGESIAIEGVRELADGLEVNIAAAPVASN